MAVCLRILFLSLFCVTKKKLTNYKRLTITTSGHETTASALTSVLYHLALNKDIQEKARAEAIAVLGDKSEDIIPTLEQTKEFKYINQVIKEVRVFYL